MSESFIKDPIHGNIEFNDNEQWALEIINTYEFKRLLTITQLGECANVFYSAKHTRFSHSLGVFHLAKQFLNALKIDDIKKRNIVLAAALLHDIGHGPKSHSFELYTNHHHEKMTIAIILNKNSNINKILEKYKIDINEVIQIIEKKHKNKWMIEIVSSQLDADRLDYLLRDSYHSGVVYGKSVDYSFLFKKMMIYNNHIIFDKKVVNLIETILFAREQMFKQLYTNIHVLCHEAIIIKVFQHWKKLYKNQFKFKDKYKLYYLFESFLNDQEWDIKNFLELNETVYNMILISLWEEDDKTLKSLLNSYFLNNCYFLNQTNAKYYDYLLIDKNLYTKKEPIYILDKNKIYEIDQLSPIIKNLSFKRNTKKFLLKKK